jgi:serine/threonine protein kinase
MSACVACSKCFRLVAPEARHCERCGQAIAASYQAPWLASTGVAVVPAGPTRNTQPLPALVTAPQLPDDDLPPSAAPVGTVFAERYCVEAVLGAGGMGIVYLATDQHAGRRVALKVLDAELVSHPKALLRMRQEAVALRRVDHPNVVGLFDAFEVGNQFALALELVAGGTLARHIGREGLPYRQVINLLQGVLAGLEAIHQAELIHRDIKPDNVLLSAAGVPKLADLGIARDQQQQGGTRTQLGARLGTPHYMSPEQAQGLALARTTDIFSVAVMACEMLTGQRLFEGNSEIDVLAKIVRGEPDLTGLHGRCPPEMVDILKQALNLDPERRFGSARALARALAQTA